MNEVQTFWERKILRWEESRYSGWSAFYPLAWTIRARLKKAASAIRQRAKPEWRLLDLGCGSGRLAEALAGQFPNFVGLDIAANAINEARRRVPSARFEVADVVHQDFPPADLTIFLGLTDWLTPEQLDSLLNRIRSAHLLFSYTQASSWNPYRFYRRMADQPSDNQQLRARTFTNEQIESLLSRTGWSGEHLTRAHWNNPGALVWATRK